MINATFGSHASREDRVRGLLECALLSDSQGRIELEHNGNLEAATRNYNADALIEQLETLVERLPKREVQDHSATRNAADFVSHNFRSALAKARDNNLQSISDEEITATEAVILADGSRPTMLLSEGLPPLDHPLIGQWRNELTALADHISSTASSICRIEPTHGSAGDYFGTGFLFDESFGLVLTNQHVLEAILHRMSTLIERKHGKHKIHDGVFVDFSAEADTVERRRFKVVEAWATPIEGDDFSRLDIAVLRIEPVEPCDSLPKKLELETLIERGDGAMISFCTIGYPGPPANVTGTINGVDLSWVHRDLFGGRYGLKRIAPGKVHRAIGTIENDERSWIFGHDATTLGGASGSPIISWLDGNRAVGIHFAGAIGKSNYAHSLKAAYPFIQDYLKIIE